MCLHHRRRSHKPMAPPSSPRSPSSIMALGGTRGGTVKSTAGRGCERQDQAVQWLRTCRLGLLDQDVEGGRSLSGRERQRERDTGCGQRRASCSPTRRVRERGSLGELRRQAGPLSQGTQEPRKEILWRSDLGSTAGGHVGSRLGGGFRMEPVEVLMRGWVRRVPEVKGKRVSPRAPSRHGRWDMVTDGRSCDRWRQKGWKGSEKHRSGSV